MRTAQLILSAVALALAAGQVAVLTSVTDRPGLEDSALNGSYVVMFPLWCLLAGLFTRRVGWKLKLTLLLFAAVEVVLAASSLANTVEKCREARSPAFPTYILGLSVGIGSMAMAPFGIVSLILAGIVSWVRRQDERAAERRDHDLRSPD